MNDEAIQKQVENVLSDSVGELISLVAFESTGDGWGAGFLTKDGPFLAFYEGDEIEVEPFTPELDESMVVEFP